ncbi:MerR family transcriptional regulator [Actinoplanes sp. NPDC049265]|uniref:MerR family transcriptional regulator n=1 Tax=Actinoplanes sp. NPDC049265 TaxID=3363902 RepID=UPI00371DB347
MNLVTMTIGQMSARTGVPPRLLRYYEEQHLITPGRDGNGYRVYCEMGVQRIGQIRSLLDAGLQTRAIADLLPRLSGPGIVAPAGDGFEVLALLCREATALQERIDELTARRAAIIGYAADVLRVMTSDRSS